MDSFLNFGFWILACTKNLQTYRDNQIFHEMCLKKQGIQMHKAEENSKNRENIEFSSHERTHIKV